MSTVQDCEVSSTQTQNVDVNNTGIWFFGKVHLDQQSEIRSDCFSDSNKQAQLQNQLISTITQAVTAQNIALIGAFGSSVATASANLNSIIKNNVTMSNIQKSYNSLKQSQSATFNNSGVIGFAAIDLTQGSKLFAAATLQEVDKAGVFNQISNYVDQKSSATMTNPLDFITNAISAISSSIMMAIVFFIVIIAAIFILPRMGSSTPAGVTTGAP